MRVVDPRVHTACAPRAFPAISDVRQELGRARHGPQLGAGSQDSESSRGLSALPFHAGVRLLHPACGSVLVKWGVTPSS